MFIKRRLREIKNVIFLGILFGIFIVILFIFAEYSAQVPLKVTFWILLIEYILFQILGRMLSINISFPEKFESKDVPVKYKISVNKKSIYPYKKMELSLRYKNRYEQKTASKKMTIFLNDKIKQWNVYEITGLSCGYTDFEIETLYLYDMFGLGSIKLKMNNKKVSMLVMPVAKPIDIDLLKVPYISGDENELFIEERGKDSSELFEIREFRDGDSLNRVHWKLSSKSNELMVRDSILAIETKIYIFVDLCEDARINDNFENAISIAYELRSQGYGFYIAWFDNSTNRLMRRIVSEYEQIEETMAEVMEYNLYKKDDEVTRILNRFMSENHEIYNLFFLS